MVVRVMGRRRGCSAGGEVGEDTEAAGNVPTAAAAAGAGGGGGVVAAAAAAAAAAAVRGGELEGEFGTIGGRDEEENK